MDGSIFVLMLIGMGGLISLALMGFWIWTLIDVITNEPSEGNDKLIWILVIVFTGFVGSLIYVFLRRPQRLNKFGRYK